MNTFTYTLVLVYESYRYGKYSLYTYTYVHRAKLALINSGRNPSLYIINRRDICSESTTLEWNIIKCHAHQCIYRYI